MHKFFCMLLIFKRRYNYVNDMVMFLFEGTQNVEESRQ